jgi:thiaminase/transcriptional activator TenA
LRTQPEPASSFSFSARLREQCDGIWAGLHGHPFLGDLTRGTLPLEAFRFFIEQDLLFLPAFARCMAMGAAKSRDEDELEFFSRQLDGIVSLEIPSNRRLLDQVTGLGAEDRGGSLAMAPANLAYTSFLLATAAAGGPLEIVAAILPCSWSYVEIARGLKDELAAHPVYSDWVSFYLADSEAELVQNMRETFDEMVREEAVSDRKRGQLAEIFMMSSRLEGMFWDMAYTQDQWPDLALAAGVGQAGPDGLGQRVPVRQDPLAAGEGVAQHRHGVAIPAHEVVQMPQVGQAGQRVRVVGAKDPLGIGAALLQ